MKLVGERRALAAFVFAFYALLYLLFAVLGASPPLTKMLFALGGVYGLAFFSLVAGYFWARWYALGVGIYGVISGAIGLWQMGPEPIIVVIGGSHLVATLALMGQTMKTGYDGQLAWREKFHMDDNAVQRLGRSVIRAGVSLPVVLAYALMPRSGSSSLVAVTAIALAGFGLSGLVRLKTWGVLAIGTAAGVLLAASGAQLLGGAAASAVLPAVSGGMLAWVAAPFVAPIARFVR